MLNFCLFSKKSSQMTQYRVYTCLFGRNLRQYEKCIFRQKKLSFFHTGLLDLSGLLRDGIDGWCNLGGRVCINTPLVLPQSEDNYPFCHLPPATLALNVCLLLTLPSFAVKLHPNCFNKLYI